MQGLWPPVVVVYGRSRTQRNGRGRCREHHDPGALWWPGGGRTPLRSIVAIADIDEDMGTITAMSSESDDPTAEAAAALEEARSRLASVPAETVVTNHAIGLYELAAIHLSSGAPDLTSASLAIDSLAAIVEGLGPRLGDEHPTLIDALANIRMAFVAVHGDRLGQEPD